MRSIVSDRRRDYIFASNFTVLVNHLDSLVNETCKDIPSPPTTRPRPRTLQFPRRIFSVIVGVRNDAAKDFVLLHGDSISERQQLAVGFLVI